MVAMPTIAVIATLDTKGREAQFLRERITSGGVDVLMIDTGVREPVSCTPDVDRFAIAEAAGSSVQALVDRNDRGQAVTVMGDGLAALLSKLVLDGKVQGALCIGGSGGTSIGATAFRALPVGFPKLIVSTVASGRTDHYMGVKDIAMMPSVVDVEGLNRILIPILSNAAAAMVGMVTAAPPKVKSKPLVAVTMFGVTTECVKHASKVIEAAGYETVVFHAVGTGGRAMESLIAEGFFAGVLDMTTTEWCDQLVGGVFPAGEHRLEAAGRKGIPQVVCPGALDMVNFGGKDTVPPQFADRKLYVHNPQVTLMRTNVEENIKLGAIIAKKLNAATGPTMLCLPLRGVSAIDAEGQPFDDPTARLALFDTLREQIDRNVVELIEMDCQINDEMFATEAARWLLSQMRSSDGSQ